jgi:hypothetical protein
MGRFMDAQPVGARKPAVIFAGAIERRADERPTQLFDEFFDYWSYLVSKNRSQVNFSRRYVQWAPPER